MYRFTNVSPSIQLLLVLVFLLLFSFEQGIRGQWNQFSLNLCVERTLYLVGSFVCSIHFHFPIQLNSQNMFFQNRYALHGHIEFLLVMRLCFRSFSSVLHRERIFCAHLRSRK